MLKLSDDWSFDVDPQLTQLSMSPKGFWGFEIRCQPTPITSGGLTESLAPLLRFEDLPLEVGSWKELVGMEIFQHDQAWRGEGGEPRVIFGIDDEAELRETTVKVVGVEGTSVKMEISAVTDVYYDDGHDTDVPLTFAGLVPVDGVRFRFHAQGVASKDPEGRAIEILAGLLDAEAFGEPEVEQLEPGIYAAYFPPVTEAAGLAAVDESDDELPAPPEAELDPETRHAIKSATELLQALEQQEWIELEEGGAVRLAPNLVPMLDLGGRGRRRGNMIAEWFLEQDDVVDLHCTDDDLGRLLDKFW